MSLTRRSSIPLDNWVIVDTTVWIEYFRKGKGPLCDLLDELLEQQNAAICRMIELEILQALKSNEQKLVRHLFSALRFIETDPQDFIHAGEKLCKLREKGITIPSSDGLIGALCIGRNIPILTLDTHFNRVSELKKISLKNVN